MKILFKILVLILCIFFFKSLPATHLVGGTTTYKCLGDDPNIFGNKRFEIKFSIYRDCSPTVLTGLDLSLPYTIHVGLSGFFSQGDIARTTLSRPNLFLGSPCLSIPPSVCIEKATYVDTISLPRPFTSIGYTISHQRCCRNFTALNILDPQDEGQTYFITIPQIAFDDCNSSPTFDSEPPFIMCLNDTVNSPLSASDINGNTLEYSFSTPYIGADRINPNPGLSSTPPFARTTWIGVFNTNNQITADPKLTINSLTGKIKGLPNSLGAYVFSTQVEEFKSPGVSYGVINRDILVTVITCPLKKSVKIDTQTVFCNGLTLSFKGNGSSNDKYFWNFGVPNSNLDTSTLQFPTYTYQMPGVYKVKLRINKGYSCEDSTTTTVRAYNKVVADIDQMNLCSGKKINFINKSIGTKFLWNFGDPTSSSNVSTLRNASYTYSDTGVYDVKIIVEQGEFCEQTQIKRISVYDTVVAIIKPQDSFCKTLSYQFIDRSINPLTHHWDFGFSRTSIDLSQMQNPIANFPDKGSYLVTLTAAKGHICENTTTRLFYIYEKPLAKINFKTPVCTNQQVLFNNLSEKSNAYDWNILDFTDKLLKKSDDFSFDYIFSKEGKYSLKFIAKVEGRKVFCADTITTMVIVNPSPKASFTLTPNKLTIFNPHVEMLNTTKYKSVFFVSDVNLTMSDKFSHQFLDTGKYVVKQVVENEFKCKDSLSKSISVDPELFFYIPNSFTPNGDNINDKFGPVGKYFTNYTLIVYTRAGNEVFKTNEPNEFWDGKIAGHPASIDSYPWLITFKYNRKEYRKKGFVVLSR